MPVVVVLLVVVLGVCVRQHRRTVQKRRREEFRKDMAHVATLRRIKALTPRKERDS